MARGTSKAREQKRRELQAKKLERAKATRQTETVDPISGMIEGKTELEVLEAALTYKGQGHLVGSVVRRNNKANRLDSVAMRLTDKVREKRKRENQDAAEVRDTLADVLMQRATANGTRPLSALGFAAQCVLHEGGMSKADMEALREQAARC